MNRKNSMTTQDYQRFILANTDGTDYGVETNTDAERVAFLYKTFTAEYGWHADLYGNRYKAIKEWLMGVPYSAVSLPFYNHDILEHGRKWGVLSVDASKRVEATFLRKYWERMAKALDRLFFEHQAPQSRAFWKPTKS